MALTKPFAANGDKTPIKLDTTADGVVNYENGFGARYSMPIKAVIDSGGNITKTGGLQIERGQMNQILNDFSSAIIENQENIGVLSNLQTTAKDNLVGAINEVNSTTPKLLTKELTLTVGAGGDFEDLKDAIDEALRYKKNRHSIVITIKTGHIVRKPIVFYSTDLSYINIISEVPAEEILVSRESAISKTRGFYTFMAFRQGSVSPMINCIFKYDDSTLPSGVTSDNHSMAFNFEGSTLRIGESGGFLSNIGNGVRNFHASNLILIRAPRIETSDSTKFAVMTSVASITQGSAKTGSTAQPYNITRNTITDDGSMHLY